MAAAGLVNPRYPKPIFDIDADIKTVAISSLIITLLAISIFVAKDVKKQKVLSLLLSMVLTGVIAVSGSVFVVSMLLLSDLIL